MSDIKVFFWLPRFISCSFIDYKSFSDLLIFPAIFIDLEIPYPTLPYPTLCSFVYLLISDFL